jgi:ABC-type lipoprotein export system ATPase subunit/ABC-type antimicrobial peptide transport system permease subunit
MIELKNVSKFYNDNKIVTVGLKNVSLKLNKGEFVAITGDSGSGKSTLLNVISSIDGYDDGEILFYGNETFYFNQNDSDIFRKNNVSFVFQKYNIVDSYTVLENVMLPLIIKGKSDEEARSEAFEIIRRVGLEDRMNNKGTKLSGGEKQRCVIARALATDAPILACDEPTGNLDSRTSREIIELIKEVSEDKLVLIVTHDYESIKDVCTRKIKMSDGEVVEDVTFTEVAEDEDRELELRDSKPSKSTLLKIALLNIRSTPKKTVFSTLVFAFVSCLLLLLTLIMVRVSYEEGYGYSDSYGIISDDRLIIYSSDHDTLDMTELSPILKDAEYYENAFYEEIIGFIHVGSYGVSSGQEISFQTSVTFHRIPFELVYGSEEPKAGEFVLVLPEYYYTSYYNEFVGEKIYFVVDAVRAKDAVIGELVGIAVSDKVNQPYIYCSEFNESVVNLTLNNEVELSYDNNGINGGAMRCVYDQRLSESYFAIPSSIKEDVDFTFNAQKIYSVSYTIDAVYTDTVEVPTLYVGADYFEGRVAPTFDGTKEITVYTDDVHRLEKQVQRLGYNVSIPSQMEIGDEASRIVLYMLIAVVIIALVIMFYISFAIIQRVYITKIKDYSIFRTLGLVSKDLKKVLYVEVMSITLVSLVLGAVLAYAISSFAKMGLSSYFSVILAAFYVIAMTVFGLATSARLNNKIFKNSVYHSLREGGE